MKREFDGNRCLEILKAIWENDRFGDFRHFRHTADTVEKLLRGMGLTDVEALPLPADGATRQLDWTVPRAWDVYDAGMILLQESGNAVLADYSTSSLCAMMFSGPLKKGEYTIVPASSGDWRGRIVYTEGAPKDLAGEAVRRGAAALVSDHFPVYPGVREEDDPMGDCCRWENDLFYPRNDSGLAGFGISRKAGALLRGVLEKEGSARAEAWLDARAYDGEIRTISGSIPGKGTEEEILLCAHLYEPGANDNASGCAMLCHLAECMLDSQDHAFRRGIRLVMGYESAGMSGYLSAHPDILRRAIAALNCDMVGAAAEEKARLHIWDTAPRSGTFMHSMLLGMAKREGISAEAAPFDIGDCLLAEPMTGIPCCSLVMHPANSYHSSLDTPKRVSAETLEKIGRFVQRFVSAMIAPAQEDIAFAEHCLEEERFSLTRQSSGNPFLKWERFEAALESFERWAFRDTLARIPVRRVPGAATLGGRLRGTDPACDPFYDRMLNTALFLTDGKRTLRGIIRLTCDELGEKIDPEITSRIERFFDEAAHDGIVAFAGEG